VLEVPGYVEIIGLWSTGVCLFINLHTRARTHIHTYTYTYVYVCTGEPHYKAIQDNFFFFGFEENPTPRKAHFVGSGEQVKPRLSQALTRGARPDSNSRPAVQISSPLPSRYAPLGQKKEG
jgi:hypothetical protein